MIDEKTLQQRMQKIGDLVGRLDGEQDVGRLRANSRQLLESVMDLHGEALDRMLQRLRDAGKACQTVLDGLVADPVVSSVLLLYGLHPLDLESRVRIAVEQLQPAMRQYGCAAELVSVTGGAVRIRLRGVDNSFTARTVKAEVEDRLAAAAPDAASLALLGLEKFAAPDFVPLEMVGLATEAVK